MRSCYVKFFLMMELVLLCFMGIFYYSCGDALYVRESDGDIDEFSATNDAGELTEGMTAEQVYTSWMDRVTKAGVMVSDYGRELTGSIYLCLEDITDGRILAEGKYPAKDVGVGRYLYLDIPVDCLAARGHQMKFTVSSDGTAGDAPTVYYNTAYEFTGKAVAKDASFRVNGMEMQGTMCITVQGENYVWTGPNFRKLLAAAVLVAAVLYWLEVLRCARGKVSYFFGFFTVAQKYGFLIRQLVARDFKTRYKRSVLGVFWSFLNPLLMMGVQYVVFSQLFRSDIENYPVYLLSGLVVFNFFSEGVGQALGSIVGNAALITKVYIPKYVYPVTRVMSSGINLLMSLIPLFAAVLITGGRVTRAYLMLPYFLLCLMVFTTGLGMAMGAAMTFFRDMQFLWSIISMLWMYLTPLFYPLSILPEGVRAAVGYNPMLHFVDAVREIVMEGTAPRPSEFAVCLLWAVAMLVAGSIVFKRSQDKFVFYI